MRKVLFAWAIAAMAVLSPGLTLAGEAEDEVVANQIAKNLKDSGRLQDYRIGVAFREGTAWLNGSVTDAEQLVAALEVAQGTDGVQQVVNRLETKPAAKPASKQPISARLRSSLKGLRSQDQTAQQAVMPASEDRGIQLTTSNVEQQMVRQQAAQRSTWPAVGQQQQDARSLPQPPRGPYQQAPQQRMAMAPQQRMTVAPQGPPAQYSEQQRRNNVPMPYARMARANTSRAAAQSSPGFVPGTGAVTPARYDHANMPNYAWPSYAASPNYAAVTYPKQYSPTAWPYIGPFYPYPQVPLGWRKVTLQWDDGWWMLDFHEKH